ncbi:ABC transporter substrate-binding protein [Streptomyces sp. B6B3]|uniref:ABC transporter substrate-binding protein n=1 Tax=Streptomyces sp. B6B3 TaxID=3153570 RepID=UPI00325E851B
MYTHRAPRHRRLAAALAAAAVLVGSLAACGSDDADADADADLRSTAYAPPEDGAFPVTIEHRFGSTTVEEEPQRVVTVGLTDQDAVLALGRVPVATTEWLGLHDAAIGPWAADLLGDAERPKLLTDPGTGPRVEAIAEQAPDLILALYAGLTEEQYDNLSKIAPVVAAPEEFNDWGIPWQEQTRIVGQALGRPQAANDLVDEVESGIAAERREHPEFAEATGVAATPYEGFFVYGSQDIRSRMLADLGFALPDGLDDEIGDEFGANISRERTELLDQSVAVWLVPDLDAAPDDLHADELYGDLNVVTEGREVFVQETSDYGAAFSFATALSVPYLVERLVPQLTAAVDGDPATAVETPAD